MPPADADLTTLDNVKLLIRNEDEFDDDAFEYLIPNASDMIRQYTERQFTVPTVNETREVIVYQDGTVYLDEAFANRSITVTDQYGASVQFQVRPEVRHPKGCWIFFGKRNPGLTRVEDLGDSYLDFFTRNMNGVEVSPRRDFTGEVLRVQTTWGYDGVPRELDYLTARTVVEWFRGEVADYSTMYAAESRMFLVPEQLPTAVTKALKPWKLPYSARNRI